MRTFVAAALILLGCKGKPPEPYAGPLTGERIMGVSEMVHPFDDYDEAVAKVAAQLGKPTGQKGALVQWGVVEGDACTFFQFEKYDKNPKQVGAVYHPAKVEKSPNVLNAQDECLEAAGKKLEDPAVPGPPTDGTPVTVAQIRTGTEKARSRWAGKRVKVAGFLAGRTTATSGDKTTVTISVTDAKDAQVKDAAACTFDDAKDAPTTPVQWDPITVEGTIGDSPGAWLSGCAIK
jgi:hypothetical protein